MRSSSPSCLKNSAVPVDSQEPGNWSRGGFTRKTVAPYQRHQTESSSEETVRFTEWHELCCSFWTGINQTERSCYTKQRLQKKAKKREKDRRRGIVSDTRTQENEWGCQHRGMSHRVLGPPQCFLFVLRIFLKFPLFSSTLLMTVLHFLYELSSLMVHVWKP